MYVVQCTLTPDLFSGVFLGWMSHTRESLGQLFKKLLHKKKKKKTQKTPNKNQPPISRIDVNLEVVY